MESDKKSYKGLRHFITRQLIFVTDFQVFVIYIKSNYAHVEIDLLFLYISAYHVLILNTCCVLDTTLCDKVCLMAGRWFSPGTSVSSTNKTDRHDITEILLKVALNTITLTPEYILTVLNFNFVILYCNL